MKPLSQPLDVVAVGEVLMDLIAPEAGSLGEAHDFILLPGGAPANVAVAAARLEARSAFVGAVGADPFGDTLRGVLSAEGLDLRGLRSVPERTTLALVAANRGGIPHFVFYRGSDAALGPDDIPLDVLSGSTFIYLSSMALLSEPSADATRYAMEVAREAECLVAVDPNLRPSSWPSTREMCETVMPLVRGADVLKVNEDEALLLAGVPDLDAALNELAEEDTLVVATCGGGGCYWRWGEDGGHISAPRVAIADTTGAGDAFMGALIAELARERFSPTRKWPMDTAAVEAALQFACAAGAAACTSPGAMAALPTRPEVERLLS